MIMGRRYGLFKLDLTPQFFLRMAIKHLRMLILFTVVGGIIGLIYANYFVTPLYSTGSKIFIQNFTAEDAAKEAAKRAQEQGITDKGEDEDIDDTDEDESQNNGVIKIYTSDLAASQSIASYCITLFNNNAEIAGMLNGCSMVMSQVPESSFVDISMTSTDPQLCADTCNAVTDRICGSGKNPSLFKQIFGAGGATVINYATVPTFSTYPNVQQMALTGLGVGFFIAAVLSFLLELIDTTVKYDDDLQKLYDIPVFGEILDFNTLGGEKYAYKASDDEKS